MVARAYIASEGFSLVAAYVAHSRKAFWMNRPVLQLVRAVEGRVRRWRIPSYGKRERSGGSGSRRIACPGAANADAGAGIVGDAAYKNVTVEWGRRD